MYNTRRVCIQRKIGDSKLMKETCQFITLPLIAVSMHPRKPIYNTHSIKKKLHFIAQNIIQQKHILLSGLKFSQKKKKLIIQKDAGRHSITAKKFRYINNREGRTSFPCNCLLVTDERMTANSCQRPPL